MLRELIDVLVFSANHQSVVIPNDPRAGLVGYYKDECRGHVITELVAIKPKAYSCTTCQATLFDPERPDAQPPAIKHKHVANSIARATIKQIWAMICISRCTARAHCNACRTAPYARSSTLCRHSKSRSAACTRTTTSATCSRIWRMALLIRSHMHMTTTLFPSPQLCSIKPMRATDSLSACAHRANRSTSAKTGAISVRTSRCNKSLRGLKWMRKSLIMNTRAMQFTR